MVVLGYLSKLKRGLGIAFDGHFLPGFSIIMSLIWYSINGQSFIVIPFSFSRYQTKCVNKFLLRQYDVINFKIYLRSTSKAMADRGKKRGRRIYKNWLPRERKEHFKWNKKYFSWFLKGYHLVRNKNFIKNSGHKLRLIWPTFLPWKDLQ